MRCSCCQKELINNLTLRELFFPSSQRCYHCEKLFSKIDQHKFVQVVVDQIQQSCVRIVVYGSKSLVL